jgi:hypothetical protein
MAFLIPDNLKSRTDVPSSARRVASAFQVGLDESVVVWYEPLYDPSGGKPHFVIMLPDRGVILLEVLEAKAAKILGVIRGKIRLERDGREVEVGNPLSRAEMFADILRKRINLEARLSGLKISVKAGAVFPSLTIDEAKKKGLERILLLDKCLFRTDIEMAIAGEGEAGLLRTFTCILGGASSGPANPVTEKILRGLIQPETVISGNSKETVGSQLSIFRPPENPEEVIRVMDRRQESMAKSLGDGHRIIRGVAGSGKTLVLLYRARLLSALFPNKRFLVTCYTRSLAGQLRELLKYNQNVSVMHLDRLMVDAIQSAKMPFPGYKSGSEEVAKTALQALEKHNPTKYAAVLLDEAQDFDTVALEFAKSLLEPGADDLVVAADAAQNIFRKKFSWAKAGIQAQGRTRILRINYRNTKEILEFASRFLLASKVLKPEEVPDTEDENTIIPPESAARTGERPALYLKKDVSGEIDETLRQVKSWTEKARQPRSVAVLYPGSSDSAKIMHEQLKKNRVKVFWLTNPEDKFAKDRLATATEPVVLSTIHSAKGLEFPYVVLCGVWSEREELEVNRKLAYVGMTRATDHLAVISRGGHPLVADLEHANS